MTAQAALIVEHDLEIPVKVLQDGDGEREGEGGSQFLLWDPGGFLSFTRIGRV